MVAERGKGLQINELVREGDPTQEILKAVAEERADILLMESHEQSRIEHFLFGRSNESIIRRMPCSILLIKNEPEAVGFG